MILILTLQLINHRITILPLFIRRRRPKHTHASIRRIPILPTTPQSTDYSITTTASCTGVRTEARARRRLSA